MPKDIPQQAEEIYISFENFCIEKEDDEQPIQEFEAKKKDEAYADITPVESLTGGDLLVRNKEIALDATDMNILIQIEEAFEGKTRTLGGHERPLVGTFFKGGERTLDKIKDFMSKGNSKLSEDIFIFDLPAGRCGETGACPFKVGYCPGCYAKNSELRQPPVFPARNRNMIMIKQMIEENKQKAQGENGNLSLLERKIMLELSKRQSQTGIVRIHSSGDFFNDAYIKMWANIASQYKDIFFYTYTKADKHIVLDSADNIRFTLNGLEFDRERLLDFTPLKSLSNVAVIPSYIDINEYDDEGNIVAQKTTFNFGEVKFVKDAIQTYPNNNIVLNVEKPFIVMNELGEAYPIVANYSIAKVTKTIKGDKEERKPGTRVEQLPETDEFTASKRASELTKQAKEAGKDTEFVAVKKGGKHGGIISLTDKFVSEAHKKSYNAYDLWLCPATNPAIRTSIKKTTSAKSKKPKTTHLIQCGSTCKYCTSPTKKKRVAFWLH